MLIAKDNSKNAPKDDLVIVFSSLPNGTWTSAGGAYGGLTEGKGIPTAIHIASIECGSCIIGQWLINHLAIYLKSSSSLQRTGLIAGS